MVLLSLVASHSDVDLETVARLSAGSAQVASGVLEDGKAVSGAVVLSTCNRLEIYCEAESEAEIETARAEVISAISGAAGLAESVVARCFGTKIGSAVTEHLFSVGAGLDSAVVGEREIAGQVRRALIQAQDQGTASAGLVRLFQAASRTAKEVGARTALGGRGLSVVSVALDLATDLSEERNWAGKNVVVFGTGAYAGATMALLRERGCTDISVYSPSGRAATFTATRGGTPLTRDSLPAALAAADVVIGCSGSDSQVGADDVARVREGAGKPLIIVDLALTHDFDPAAADLEGVELITLESVRLAAPEEQAGSVRQAAEIVATSARAFEDQQKERSVDSAIVALRRHTMQVLENELEKVRNQHGCTGPAEEVEFAMRRMVKQLLHLPTVRARELASAGRQDDYIAALEALYGITVEEPAARGAAAAPDACPVPHGSAVAESA
ncbi:glutamyl-tRNA reductase [Arthrobacter sp. I2-34]|uniref:Glutamyl-tRNA reductase n=1 Tax=Arthrobacter hankyongi TaxID=2904801 RepID=A0ABS9L8G8_9MICC|nr:glutamyl-tRNA reductase [Arthrobacter hankyongi]MCG2622792.1 glutamyl-tRNA reductase [Arthrobacter hankyongi]